MIGMKIEISSVPTVENAEKLTQTGDIGALYGNNRPPRWVQ
jgi:hypothetical protein